MFSFVYKNIGLKFFRAKYSLSFVKDLLILIVHEI